MKPQPGERLAALVPFAGVFAHGMGQAMVFAILPSLGREIGLREVAIGTIISLSSLVFFLGSRMWGRISDRWGRKRVILIGLWGYTVGTLVFAGLFGLGMAGLLGGSVLYALIVATRMAQAVVMSGTGPGTAAYVADTTTPATRAAGMGRLSAASNLGSILGPAIAGVLAGISLLLPLVFAAIVALLAAMLVAKLLPTERVMAYPHPKGNRLRLLDRRFASYMVLGIAVFTGISIVQQTLAFRIQDTLHLDSGRTAQTYGFVMMISAAASLFAQSILVQRLKLQPMMLLRIGTPLLLLAFTVLVFSASFTAFAAALAVMGLGLGLCGPGFTAATSLAVSAREQGAAAGITTAVPALGFIVGPIAGTWLYEINPHYPYILTTLIMVPCSVLAFRLRQTLHADQPPAPASGS